MKARHPFLAKKRGKALIVFILCLPLLGLLGLLALRHSDGQHGGGAAGGGTTNAITDDTYFYGQSEPVYPSR
jgi:beta-glucosidase